jgi:hypothetical protein
VEYRDMPATPDAFCSVHSSVMPRRTSFFFDAATTTSDPRPAAGAVEGARNDTAPVRPREESMLREAIAIFARRSFNGKTCVQREQQRGGECI